MLNRKDSQGSLIRFYIILCLLLITCKGSKTFKDFKDDSELSQFLNQKGYILDTYGWKLGEKIETIEMRKTTKYSPGDFELICSIPTISILYFDGGEVPSFNETEVETCAKIKNIKLDFRRVKLNVSEICKVSEKMKDSSPKLYFTDTNVNDEMFDCFTKVSTLEGIGVFNKFEITESSICKLTSKVKSITTFRLSDVSFSRNTLECIFSLPNLKAITLQNWSQVPGQEIWDLVHEYEDRHGRKLDAIIDDPTSIDSTVRPKENQ